MEFLSDVDLIISREKSRRFLGLVKVPLDKLQPEPPPLHPRQLDPKNVSALVQRFLSEGCLRHDPEHYVPTLIAPQNLPPNLVSGNTDCAAVLQQNDEPPIFNPEQPLTYLHGRHRLEAARRFCDESERWWIVTLYSDSTIHRCETDLLVLTTARSVRTGERRTS